MNAVNYTYTSNTVYTYVYTYIGGLFMEIFDQEERENLDFLKIKCYLSKNIILG